MGIENPQIIAAIIVGSCSIIAAVITALIQRSTPETPAENGTGEKKDKKIRTAPKFLAGISVLCFALALILLVIAKTGTQPAGTASAELPFHGWHTWPEDTIKASVSRNTVTLNGKATMAGYVTEGLNAAAMRNKTVTLEIRNAERSIFNDGQMIKITVNEDDLTVEPDNIPNLIEKEYVPETITQVVFMLPHDFDGKLGFVFYNADLRNLQITATYR